MSLHSGQFILISSQPVIALTPEFCVFFVEATNTNFIVFDFDQNVPGQPLHHRSGPLKIKQKITNKIYL